MAATYKGPLSGTYVYRKGYRCQVPSSSVRPNPLSLARPPQGSCCSASGPHGQPPTRERCAADGLLAGAALRRRAGRPAVRLADFFDAAEMERSLEVAQSGVEEREGVSVHEPHPDDVLEHGQLVGAAA